MAPTTNRLLNQKKEKDCIAISMERKYYHLPQNKTFIKRSLRAREWQINLQGLTVVPRLGPERLRNEAAVLQFIKAHTSIPVPTVKAAFDDDDAFYLVLEYIEGVGMNELSDDQRAVVVNEVEEHLQTLHKLRSRKLGGPTGIVIPPHRALIKTFRDDWNIPDAHLDDYVFCHNDLSQQNIVVDPETLKITAILDWEYAGFYPAAFEKRIFERLGHSGVVGDEVDDSDMIVKFFVESHQD
nr:serine/threonine-protein kinase d [Quercus suber]